MSTKDRAIDAFKTVMGSKEPFHERIIGQLGDAAGTVEVPNRPNINYVRLGGSDTLTVRAYNLAVMPELDRYVWVEITRVEGEPKYYRVVGYSESESEGSPASPPVYPGGQSAEEPAVVWETGDGFFTNEKVHSALAGAEVHTNIASKIEMLEITAATYDDVQDWLNSTQSSGRISGGVLSVNGGDATKLDIAAGTGFIKVTDSCIGVTKFFDWDASLAKALTDGQANYIYVNYNVGTGAVTVEATVTRSDIPITTAFTLGRVFRDGANLHIIQSGVNIYCAVRLNHERLVAVRGFERASGGVIAESGQRYLTTTDGVFYLGANLDTTSAKDTTGADRFIAWYLLNGTWTETAPQQQIDNLQYNDVSVGGAEVLANLTVNRYGVFWVYIHMDSDIQVVYGQDDYKLAGAENATVPSNLPESVTEFGILAAKIIVRQNANNLLSIASAYTTPFPVSQPVNHNDLGGLQGGTTDEYYHLTATEHGYVSGVNAQSVLTTAGPTFTDLTIDDGGGTLAVLATTGYLGIGLAAAAPTSPIEVKLSKASTDDIFVNIYNTNDQITAANPIGLKISTAFAPTNYMAFYMTGILDLVAAGTPVVRMSTGSNSFVMLSLGVGVAAPGYKLDVNSSTVDTVANFESSDSVAEILITDNVGFIRIRDTGGVLSLWTGAQALTILASTYVGIGTINPQHRFHVLTANTEPVAMLEFGGSQTNVIKTALALRHTSDDTAVEDFGIDIQFSMDTPERTGLFGSISAFMDSADPAEGALAFFCGTSGAEEFMRISSAGRVAVGTATPDTLFHVYAGASGVAPAGAGITFESGTHQYINMISIADTQQGILFGGSGNNDSSILWEDGARGDYLSIGAAIYVKTGANVGINVTVPLGKVHVDQSVADAAIPVLILDQADVSEGFINFIGADQGVIDEGTSSVESVFVEYGGVVRRLALYAVA